MYTKPTKVGPNRQIKQFPEGLFRDSQVYFHHKCARTCDSGQWP